MQDKPTSRSALSAEHVVLGRAVRELRARRVLSQEELGLRSGLHRNYVGALERGEVNPTFKTLMTLTRGLDVPLSMLMRLYERRRAEA
jgi:transcriptional regulator with XRE-family HTH domain